MARLSVVRKTAAMKRFDYAAEVPKQLITISAAIITLIVAFYEKFFSHHTVTFVFVFVALVILILSGAAGVLSIGGLVHGAEEQERSDFENAVNPTAAKRFVTLYEIGAPRYAAVQQVLFGIALILFVLVAIIDRACLSKRGSTSADPAKPAAARTDQPIVWAQLRPDTDSAKGQLLVRAIVARAAACPALTVKETPWPMATRTDGSDPDFPIRMCEAALAGDAEARIGGVKLGPRPRDPRRIVVIGDTGCRITDYVAQNCDSGLDWPFFRVAAAASAMKPELVIHVGDYHYREKPCAGRTGCAGSPYGDTWAAWQADFFAPAAPLLTAAPWVMVRGNHEDCTRAGAGWNLLIRPTLGLKAGERCPPDTDPDLFAFAHLLFAVPDMASAGLDYRPEDRVVTYRNQIRALSRKLAAAGSEIWLLTHQALWVSYGQDKKTKRYDAEELLGRIPDTFDADVRAEVCGKIIDPVDTYRQWFDGVIPKENPNKPSNEMPCREAKLARGDALAPPGISLIVSGHTHYFQMFAPTEGGKPLQLIVGNGGDALESVQSFPDASKALDSTDATLFGVAGKLWMRNTFGFAVLEKSGSAWTATLHDVDGKPIARCGLERPGASCKPL